MSGEQARPGSNEDELTAAKRRVAEQVGGHPAMKTQMQRDSETLLAALSAAQQRAEQAEALLALAKTATEQFKGGLHHFAWMQISSAFNGYDAGMRKVVPDAALSGTAGEAETPKPGDPLPDLPVDQIPVGTVVEVIRDTDGLAFYKLTDGWAGGMLLWQWCPSNSVFTHDQMGGYRNRGAKVVRWGAPSAVRASAPVATADEEANR